MVSRSIPPVRLFLRLCWKSKKMPASVNAPVDVLSGHLRRCLLFLACADASLCLPVGAAGSFVLAPFGLDNIDGQCDEGCCIGSNETCPCDDGCDDFSNMWRL